MLRLRSSSSKFSSLRVSDWLRRWPVSHAGAFFRARLSGSILRMWQQLRLSYTLSYIAVTPN